jgi:hypothetical protein
MQLNGFKYGSVRSSERLQENSYQLKFPREKTGEIDERVLLAHRKKFDKAQKEFFLVARGSYFMHPRGWAIQGRTLLAESLYQAWSHRNRLRRPSILRYILRRFTSPVREISNPICLYYGSKNYYHFYNDIVFSISTLSDIGVLKDRPVLVPAELGKTSYFLEAIKQSPLLKSVQFEFQNDFEIIRVSDPIFCHPAYGRPQNIIVAVERTFESQACCNRVNISEYIYVTRKNSVRSASNESDICSALQDRGFDVVDCGRMSLEEQRQTFCNARVVIGLHGAGLTNLVHIQTHSCSVLEIFPEDFITPCFAYLCEELGLEYSAHVSTPLSASDGGTTRVDVDAMLSWLNALGTF